MARIRYIKPDFFKDEDLGQLPPLYRLAFAGLWCHADKSGRLKDRPMQLKIEILPYDDINFEDVLHKLSEMKPVNNKKSFITRYVVNEEKYIQINTFLEHQKPHHTERDSVIPPPLTVKKRLKERDIPMGSKWEVNGDGDGKGNGEGKCQLAVEEIISDLNLKTSQNYKTTTRTTIELIRTRMKEGFTVDDFKKVHSNMAAIWMADSKMRQYLRPVTLYNASKFEGYLNRTVTLADQGKVSPIVEKSRAAFQNFLAEGENAQ